jgi:hypothetical protein
VNCREFRSVIEDYHYGDLKAEVASEAQSHLSACSACSLELNLLADEDRLLRAYSESLQRHLDVSPAMWQRLRSGIQGEDASESTSSRWNLSGRISQISAWFVGSSLVRNMAFATVVAVLSIVGTLVAVRIFTPPQPRQHAASEDVPSQNSLEAAIRSVQRAELEYVQAIKLLSDMVDVQKDKLNPGQRAELERNLKAIDEAIAKARQAYHAHPDDPELGFFMLAAYREKVDLLQEIATS